MYYDDIYFKNIELLISYFNDSHLVIAGDLNSRVGTLNDFNSDFRHVGNPDAYWKFTKMHRTSLY